MNSMHANQVEIKLSKGKLFVAAIFSAMFVILGIWLITNTPSTTIAMINNPVFIKGVGIVAAGFFGFVLVWSLRRILDDTPALVLNEEGLIDNSSAVSAGNVAWKDIREVKLVKIYNQKFLMLIVNNPQDYIDRQTKSIKRKAMELNFKSYGSPISISAHSLQCSFEDLHQMILRRKSVR